MFEYIKRCAVNTYRCIKGWFVCPTKEIVTVIKAQSEEVSTLRRWLGKAIAISSVVARVGIDIITWPVTLVTGTVEVLVYSTTWTNSDKKFVSAPAIIAQGIYRLPAYVLWEVGVWIYKPTGKITTKSESTESDGLVEASDKKSVAPCLPLLENLIRVSGAVEIKEEERFMSRHGNFSGLHSEPLDVAGYFYSEDDRWVFVEPGEESNVTYFQDYNNPEKILRHHYKSSCGYVGVASSTELEEMISSYTAEVITPSKVETKTVNDADYNVVDFQVSSV